jgi:hypothetical protein
MRLLWICGLLLVVFIAPQATGAQGACPALVQMALEQMGNNCGGLGPNNACYGYNRVDSTFVTAQPPDFFNAPADRALLADLQTITTAPLDIDAAQWGVAVMNVQANVPGALPGQSIVFMLMGDTEVINTVPEGAMLPSAEPVTLRAARETVLHSGPAANTSAVTTLSVGAFLEALGLSPEGDWLRVYADQGLGWVDQRAIDQTDALADLPTITEDMRPPMQSFQVRTAFNDLLCNEAPSLLAVRSPEGLTVDLNANGVHIQMGSLVILRIVPPGDTLQVITVEGDVVLDPGTPFETPLRPGFLTERCLDADGNVSTTCGWQPPVPLTETELIFAQTVLLAYQQLGLSLGEPLVQDDGAQIILMDTDACPAGATVEYTVRRGDTLSAIGVQYNTNAAALIANNNLANTVIVPGQKLRVVCGAQGPVSLPPLDIPPLVIQSAPPPIDCTGFAATSPLDGLFYGEGTFYWDPPRTPVDSYRVTVIGESGATTFTTSGENPFLSANLSVNNVGYGFGFSWYVEALIGDRVVCSTPPKTMFREAPPPPPQPRQPDPQPTPIGTEEVDPFCLPICDEEGCLYPCQLCDGEPCFYPYEYEASVRRFGR